MIGGWAACVPLHLFSFEDDDDHGATLVAPWRSAQWTTYYGLLILVGTSKEISCAFPGKLCENFQGNCVGISNEFL